MLGYYGGLVDEIVCRAIDVFMPIPLFVLLMVLTTFFSPGVIQVSLLMGFLSSIYGIRIMRVQVLSLSQTSFVGGTGNRRIGFPHHVPPYPAKCDADSYGQVRLRFQHLLVMGVGLSFIGLWDTTTIDWGTMIQKCVSQGGLALHSGGGYCPRYSSRLCVPCPCVDRV